MLDGHSSGSGSPHFDAAPGHVPLSISENPIEKDEDHG